MKFLPLVCSISKYYNPLDGLVYNIEMKRLGESESDSEIYEPEPRDLIALTGVRPTCIDDLKTPIGSYLIALVQARRKIGNGSFEDIQILSSTPIEYERNGPRNKKQTIWFAVFLINITTNTRIWKALNSGLGEQNLNIMKKMLHVDSAVRT